MMNYLYNINLLSSKTSSLVMLDKLDAFISLLSMYDMYTQVKLMFVSWDETDKQLTANFLKD
jgi:hypothetical protein